MRAFLQLRIRLLGGLTVEGLDEREIGSRKGRTVLKLLALARGAPVPTDRIADVLWGDAPPSRPVDQVGVLVSRLRTVLGADRLPRTDAGYALRIDWLDVEELDIRVTEAEQRHAAGQMVAARAAAQAALALVRGPLLPGDDGEWVDTERAVAAQVARRARLVLAEAALGSGDHGQAVVAAEAVLAADPYDEAALRAVMRGHAGAGRPGSALAAYVRVRERLAEDLGVSPTAQTEALHDRIVLDEETPTLRSPVSPGPAVVGREDELAEILRVIDRAGGGASPFLVVEGDPGIGKTALLDVAASTAAAQGLLVVRCKADALGRDLPLQPVLDGLAGALRTMGRDAAASALGPDAPVLEPLLGWRPSDAAVSATVLAEAEPGRARLFAALLATVERLAAGRPVLLVVDDLHLADVTTMEWLHFAARRGRQLAAVAACRPGPGPVPREAQVLRLGPLDVAATALLVGPERAAELHARSGGNPLFLVELARSGDSLPETIREAVRERADSSLDREAVVTLRTAAVLDGGQLDLDLLADVLRRPLGALLTDAEDALDAGLLVEMEPTYAFANDLVRVALAAGVTAARRAFVHREAARVLAARRGADPRTVAWHARQGGDPGVAAGALVAAAAEAAMRYDHDEAERLLDDAVSLADGAAVRLARARVRLARWDIAGATSDADRALALDAGGAGFEVRGWAAYYTREYDAAQRYADEGAERATDETVRASCLALAGRTRHARGSLSHADARLVEAATCRVTEVRSVAQAWLSNLRSHQGHAQEAAELADRALLEPTRFGHPFGRFQAQFARTLALGMQGRSDELLIAAARLESEAAEAGTHGARFLPVAMNLRAWPLRAAGRVGEACDVLNEAIDLSHSELVTLAEPHYVGILDLAETLLLAGDLDAAAHALAGVAPHLRTWNGTMAWRARQRLGLLEATLRLARGDLPAAEEEAAAVAAEAEVAGSARHALLARGIAAEAAAKAGRPVDLAAVDQLLVRLEGCAGLEAWRVTARLAAACSVDRWWADADRRAAAMVGAAGPLAEDARRHVGRSLAALSGRRTG